MKYEVKITESNLEELSHEGRILLNADNLFADKHKFTHPKTLGATNYNIVNHNGFSIMEWDSLYKRDVQISGNTSSPMFAMHFMLSGNTEYMIESGKTNVIGGKSNLWSLNGGHSGYSKFQKDDYCSSLGIIIRDELLIDLTNRHPQLLGKVYRKHENGETFYWNKYHKETTAEMQYIISQLKQAHLMGNTAELYAESKILELLALQLKDSSCCQNAKCQLHCKTQSDIDKIHQAKQILLSNIDSPPSIKELSMQVGINDKKLKYGFKEVFNQTVYGYLFDHKMTIAKELLLETEKPILEVANECGYDYASHFSTAFKRKYGITPKQYKKII
ncbi:AraC family transcriptional regulator [Prolixibacteraceae bacterium JC049]|nr:AraC family transcriptional regulator [Prolixibacteraceae bacterium JC049]